MLITSLRTSLGLDPKRVPEEFADSFQTNATRLCDSGLLTLSPRAGC